MGYCPRKLCKLQTYCSDRILVAYIMIFIEKYLYLITLVALLLLHLIRASKVSKCNKLQIFPCSTLTNILKIKFVFFHLLDFPFALKNIASILCNKFYIFTVYYKVNLCLVYLALLFLLFFVSQ